VYYLNNAPFTGKAGTSDNDNAVFENYEMKDGKFHGKYFMQRGEDLLIHGNYKDGKKHGEWDEDRGESGIIQHYKNGKKDGEWKYYEYDLNDGREVVNSRLIKTEIWENDKLIKEWTKEDEEAQNKDSESWFGIDFDKLVLKGDMYYLNNVPFTGKAGYQKEMHEEWEFKDGKFHGEYAYYFDGCQTIGNYKNGKKHGKWEGWCNDEEHDIRIYEDDVLISENGVLISE
jgi:hypothetical protein